MTVGRQVSTAERVWQKGLQTCPRILPGGGGGGEGEGGGEVGGWGGGCCELFDV